MLTLWDLIPKKRQRKLRSAVAAPSAPPAPVVSVEIPKAPPRRRPRENPAHRRYDEMARAVLAEHGIRVRKWRTSMSGVAWEVYYHDGKTVRLIESPRPRGPVSAAIFLHEVGHHAIGFYRYKPRCIEEMQAWRWSLAEMQRRNINITPRVRRRVVESLEYALHKANRRGLKRIPAELVAYLDEMRAPITKD
ncbi:MAG: hypothetical protein VYC34_09230 [Planctomycetota bacterium]|nr:hypothetical protein [Planctomycetota bacterium]